jgi:hypothetical protein
MEFRAYLFITNAINNSGCTASNVRGMLNNKVMEMIEKSGLGRVSAIMTSLIFYPTKLCVLF